MGKLNNPHIADYQVRITPETAREYQRRGAKKRSENLKARKLFKEIMEKKLLEEEHKSIDEIVMTAIQQAMAGDDKARTFVAKAIDLEKAEDNNSNNGVVININSDKKDINPDELV